MNIENDIGAICSEILIENDTKTILSLMKSERDSIFAMNVLPYYALFYHSCSEYLNLSLAEKDTQTHIANIRHYIKALSNGFGKSSKQIDLTDKVQDESYRNQLEYSFLQEANIYYNLGVYFNADKKIIGNTQLMADCLGIKDIFDKSQEYGKKQFEIGKELGSFVSALSAGFKDKTTSATVIRLDKGIKIPYFYDLNTSVEQEILNISNEKQINLFFLYLLSNVNFVSLILEPLVSEENTWSFRIKYVVNYYTVQALKRYKNYCRSNNKCSNVLGFELDEIFTYSEPLFVSTFRNCMMHYGIVDEIKKELFNLDKPLFGLVESCFDRMDFDSFYQKQDIVSKMIIKCLEKQFNIDSVNLEEL